MIYNKIKYLNNKKFSYLILFSFFFLILNYSRFFFDTYNLEWYFSELSKYFYDKEYYFDIKLFKQNQANTTFYSLLLSPLNFVSNLNHYQISIMRFFNFAPFLFLIFIFYKNNILSFENKAFLLFLILLCPIINVYSFRIYPDFLSATFCWLSLIFLISKKKNASVFMFVISFLLKPVSMIIFPIILGIIYYSKENKSQKIKLIIKFLFLTIFIYFFYILNFEKIIFSSYYQNTYVQLNLIKPILNFLYYFNYATILISPVLFFLIFETINIYKKNYKKVFLFVITIIFLSLILLKYSFQNGEMNYGYINKFLINNYITFIIIFFNTIISILFSIICLNDKKIKPLFIGYVVSLIVLSILISRPTQRYLIYLIPLLFFIVIELYHNKTKYLKISLLIYIVFFSFVNYGQKIVQTNNLKSTNNIIKFIDQKKIFGLTHPGHAYHSHGYLFKQYLENGIKNKIQKLYFFKIDDCQDTDNIIKMSKVYILNFNIQRRCLTRTSL